MSKRSLPLALPLFLVFLPACAGLAVPDTGFLANRDQLEPAPDRDVRWIPDEMELFVDEGALPGEYDSVLIEPTAYDPVAEPKHEPSAEKIASLREHFDETLSETLSEHYTIVEVPGPRTLRVRASIAEVNPSNVLVNILGLILVFPPDMGGIACELEAVDATTGERRVGMAAHRDGTAFLLIECFTKYGHARHGMKKLTEELLDTLRGPATEPEAAPEP